MRLPALP